MGSISLNAIASFGFSNLKAIMQNNPVDFALVITLKVERNAELNQLDKDE